MTQFTLFEDVLTHLDQRVDLHARLINTFSQLEYIGARKIVKSQTDRSMTLELLSHITEEIRHAQILKLLALRMSDQSLETYDDAHLLAGPEGRSYIQTVDHAVDAALSGILPAKREFVNYLVTTLLIEERAAQVYPIYDLYLEKFGLSGKLSSIVRDEDKHLQAVTLHIQKLLPQANAALKKLRGLEVQCFSTFMKAVITSVPSTPSHSLGF